MPSPMPDRPPPRAYLQLLLGLVLAFQGLALAIASPKEVTVHWWMRPSRDAYSRSALLFRSLEASAVTSPSAMIIAMAV
jgi:hypothetical protein